MGAYNSQIFSKEFSKRTEDNLDFITRTVERDEKEEQYREEFVHKYKGALDEVGELIKSIREDANAVPGIQKKGKNELKSRLYAVANKLDSGKKELERNLRDLTSTGQIQGDSLYEVTQLLNSLMGIAVLPYEMHKDFFKNVDDENRAEVNRGRLLADIQRDVKSAYEYEALLSLIMKLHREGKWISTYFSDLRGSSINEDKIVFGFLSHLRNATCHSGDNALSILPLDDGQVIKEIVFYDVHLSDRQQEFAMKLSVEEVRALVKSVAEFYRNSHIGTIDKTESIKAAEKRVNELLSRK